MPLKSDTGPKTLLLCKTIPKEMVVFIKSKIDNRKDSQNER